jgi:hypothetical protein
MASPVALRLSKALHRGSGNLGGRHRPQADASRLSNAEAQARIRERIDKHAVSYRCDMDDRGLKMLVRHQYITQEEADDTSAKGKRVIHAALTLFIADCERDDPLK